MDLKIELEGKTVPLSSCDYVLWQPCGCPRGVTQAGAHRIDPVVTEHDAWKQFFAYKRERVAAQKRGLRMELMTRGRYSAEVHPLMLERTCPHKPEAESDGQQPMPELRTVDARHNRRLLVEAARDIIRNQSASRSLIQRRVRVGSLMAERLLFLLHDAGVIGPRKGNGRHEVLVPRGRAADAIAVLEKETADAATR